LFVVAKDHRITARDLTDLEREFGRLNTATSRSVLKFYQTRRDNEAVDPDIGREARLVAS